MPKSTHGAELVAASRWERYTPAQRLIRFGLLISLLLAVLYSAKSVEIIPEFLLDAPEQVRDLLVRMWPISYGFYPDGVHDPLMDTVHIATMGTILSIGLAVPVGVLSAKNLVRNTLINGFARLILVK
jgi:phosphonate transport system permease protein